MSVTSFEIEYICKEQTQNTKLPFGYQEIINFIIDIDFIPQKTFDGCKYKNKLPFDFYLPDYNICIEFQGEQHYKSIEYFGGEKTFKLTLLRDKIKMEYCRDNNIPLIVIKFDENIEEKLNNLIFESSEFTF